MSSTVDFMFSDQVKNEKYEMRFPAVMSEPLNTPSPTMLTEDVMLLTYKHQQDLLGGGVTEGNMTDYLTFIYFLSLLVTSTRRRGRWIRRTLVLRWKLPTTSSPIGLSWKPPWRGDWTERHKLYDFPPPKD